jgi:arylsulfatase A-like enzyme
MKARMPQITETIMTRQRGSFRKIAAALSRVAFGVALFVSLSAEASTRPNVVLILADDVGYSDFGAYGSEVSTPNIDALAERGVLFSNFHTSPMCASSRAMLMTGLSSHRAGVGNLPEFTPSDWNGHPSYLGHLAPDVVTIAQRLKPLGYDTYMTGKWHLGHDPDSLPSARGFDRTFILDATGADNWEHRSYLPFQEAPWYEDGEPTRLPDDYYSSRHLVDKMIEFVGDREKVEAPFFAYLAMQAVHIPVQAPREFTEKYLNTYAAGWHELREQRRTAAVQKGLIPVDAPIRPIPDKLRKWDALGTDDRAMAIKSMAVYAGMIEAMDFNIGRLIEHLKRTGQYDNTVFIVTSDNGAEGSDPLASRIMRMWLPRSGYNRDLETLGERGSYVFIGPEFANAASAPGAWFKFTSAEGGLRVPLIMTMPGMKSRRVEHGLSYVTDIAATIFDFAASGPPAPGEMTGRSLRPVLDGATHAVYAENDIIGQEAAGHSALFRGDYKITRVNPPHGDRQWRLYELATDPGETHDLATAEPERFQAMLGQYEAWAEANKVIQVPDDYTHVKQMTTNFAEHMLETRPWILAIPVVMLLSVLGLMWGLYRLVRG